MALLVAIGACRHESIEWSDPRYGGPPQPSFGIAHVKALSGACEASERIVRVGDTIFAAWWMPRADGSARLMLSQMDSSMSNPIDFIADSTDRSRRGCGRPAPAISASASGYVHIAYFAEPPDGSGVFYIHSMDNGSSFHSRVPVVFGDTPSAVSVAANGDTVVVAYEDPNSERPSIGVAVSRTAGHTFPLTSIASPMSSRATLPLVRVEGSVIHLWWSERSSNPAVSATRPVYREGRW